MPDNYRVIDLIIDGQSIIQANVQRLRAGWKCLQNVFSIQRLVPQSLLKPPELFRRYPDTAPDPVHVEIAVLQKAIDGSRRDAKIERHLLHPVIALRWWLGLLPGFLWSISLVCHHEKRSSLGHGF